VQEGWTFFKEEVFKAQEQAVPMCRKMNRRGRQVAWLNRELLLGLRKTGRSATFGRSDKRLEYKNLTRLCREDTSKAKAQLELRLATVVTDNKKCFYK